MARRVFFHIGVPKSGTTYLQRVLWNHKERLADEGVQLPGTGYVDHRWGSLVVREDDRLRYRRSSARGSWDRIVADVATWGETSLISHEFYGGASQAQARVRWRRSRPPRCTWSSPPAIHCSVLGSAWQEIGEVRQHDSPRRVLGRVVGGPGRGLELAQHSTSVRCSIVGAALVAPERVHVIPVAGDALVPEELWWTVRRALRRPTPRRFGAEAGAVNPSIGLVECRADAPRRTAPGGPHRRCPGRTGCASTSAETVLARRDGERFWPSADRVEECRRAGPSRGRPGSVAAGFDVVGDLAELAGPGRARGSAHAGARSPTRRSRTCPPRRDRRDVARPPPREAESRQAVRGRPPATPAPPPGPLQRVARALRRT